MISTLTGWEREHIGSRGVVALTNGNYVIVSDHSITWCDGDTGINGRTSFENSFVTSGVVYPLTNGNYVVVDCSAWVSDVGWCCGAVTWCDGTKPTTGEATIENSMLGPKGNDYVGSGYFLALSNGNYVFCSPSWSSTDVRWVGAVTWCDGTKTFYRICIARE